MYFAGFLADCAKTGQVGEKLSDGRRTVNIFPSVLHPESRGRVRLGSPDPKAPPKIFANYFAVEKDLKTLIEGNSCIVIEYSIYICMSGISQLIKIHLAIILLNLLFSFVFARFSI